METTKQTIASILFKMLEKGWKVEFYTDFRGNKRLEIKKEFQGVGVMQSIVIVFHSKHDKVDQDILLLNHLIDGEIKMEEEIAKLKERAKQNDRASEVQRRLD